MKTDTSLLISLRGVDVVRGRKRVLKDIDLDICGSEKRTVIIGPNGAGKSLLLQTAHGLIKPDKGTVNKPHEIGEAMVFQRPVLFRRSALANVLLALKVSGIDTSERQERARQALDQAGLSRHADTFARALSFGEQQRLALARALAIRPRVLFLDEPTASLDPAAAHLVESLIDDAARNGTRIVMTSHDLNQARRLAGEIVFLHRGRIKEHAKAEDFFNGPQNDLAQAFLRGELLWWERRSIYSADGEKGDDGCVR